MRYRRKQVKYSPGLKNYEYMKKKSNKPNICKSKFSYSLESINKRSLNKSNLVILSIGILLITIGVINIFKNTVVYTPIRFMYSISGGVSFAATSIFLLSGIAIIALNKRLALGLLLIVGGLLVICFSIFLSLRMGLLPISLIKAIAIFGSIVTGISLIGKWLFNTVRR